MGFNFFTSAGKQKLVRETVPAGLILPFAGSTAPDGWLFCSGQEVSRTTYPKLDTAIGTRYGTYTNGSGAAGTSHMRLPDLRGRAPVGCHAGSGDRTDANGPLTGTGQVTGGSAIAAVALGTWSGQENVTLTAAQSGVKQHNHSSSVAEHGHSVNNAYHYHNYGYSGYAYQSNSANTFRWQVSGDKTYNYQSVSATIGATTTGDPKSSGYVTTRSNSAVAAGSSHSNVSASLVLNFMIRAI